MRKNISLTVETVKRLDALYQAKGDSYEKIICRLIDFREWTQVEATRLRQHDPMNQDEALMFMQSIGPRFSTKATLTDPRD